jgi:hypothetical protein
MLTEGEFISVGSLGAECVAEEVGAVELVDVGEVVGEGCGVEDADAADGAV